MFFISQLRNFIPKAFKDVDCLKFYFMKVPMKGYYVACEIAKRAYQHRILDNLFSDDDSENHEAFFTLDQTFDAALMMRCMTATIREAVGGFSIFGVDIRRVEGFCRYDGNVHLEKMNWSEPDVMEVMNQIEKFNKESQYVIHFWGNQTMIDLIPNAEENARVVIEILKERLNMKNDDQLAGFLRKEYMIPMQDEYFKYKDLSNPNVDYDKVDEEYDKIYEHLLLDGKAPVKWYSEFELFKLVKKHFSDAKFQYSPEWLFPQRYDIFVPSLNTAFEYQGIQHFKVVDFFGGEEGFQKRKELDNHKKEKSKDKGVRLIEWKYDVTLSKLNLDKKLSHNT